MLTEIHNNQEKLIGQIKIIFLRKLRTQCFSRTVLKNTISCKAYVITAK